MLLPTKVQVGASLSSSYAKAKVRAVRKITSGVAVAIEAGADHEMIGDLALYSRMLLSLRPLYSLKLYFGQQVSIDGWTYIVGFKASGVKVLLPWTTKPAQIASDEKGSLHDLVGHITVGALFIAANYFFTTLHWKNRQIELERWKQKNIPLLEERQFAFD